MWLNLISLLIEIRFLGNSIIRTAMGRPVLFSFKLLFISGFLYLPSSQAFPKINFDDVERDIIGINVVYNHIHIDYPEQLLTLHRDDLREKSPFYFPNPPSQKLVERNVLANPVESLGYVGEAHTLYYLLSQQMFDSPGRVEDRHLNLLIFWLDALRETRQFTVIDEIIREYRNNPVLNAGIREKSPRDLSQFLTQHYHHLKTPADLLEQAQALVQNSGSDEDQAEAEVLAEQLLKDPRRNLGQISAGYLVLVKLAINHQNYSQAISLADRSLTKGDPDDIETLVTQGMLKKSPNIIKRALSLALAQNNLRLQCRAHIALGNAFVDSRGNYEKALDIALEVRDRLLAGQARVGLGNIKVDQKRNHEEALAIAQEKGDLLLEAQALIGLGNAKIDPEGNFQIAVNLGKTMKNNHIQAQALNGLGNFMSAQRLNREARDFYRQASALVSTATELGKKIHDNISRVEKFLAEREGERPRWAGKRRSRERTPERDSKRTRRSRQPE